MTTLLEIPLRDAAPSVIQDLRLKYPEAVLRIEAENSLHNGGMDEEQFWAIINLMDWKSRDSDKILAPAITALSQFSNSDISAFHNILAEKLYALDGQRFAEQLGSNRYSKEGDKHFSVDSFLYARCCVVANSRVFYEKVLQDPTKMPKEFTFESLLYLPREAYKLKTGRDDYDHTPETWYETFSNPEGWPNIRSLKDRILSVQ